MAISRIAGIARLVCLGAQFLLGLSLFCLPKAMAQSGLADLRPIVLNANNNSSSASSNNGSNMSHAFQMWTPVYLDVPLLKPQYRGYFEVSPRLGDNLKGMNQLLLRTAVGRRMKHNTSTYLGYVWVNNFPDHIQENRIFQQFGFNHNIGSKLQVTHRFRLEERFIEGLHGACSMRGRYLLRLSYPLVANYYLVGSDELFVNLNNIPDGPTGGIDQNRLFVGFGRKLSEKIKMECGYQMQYVNSSDEADDKAAHILITQLSITL